MNIWMYKMKNTVENFYRGCIKHLDDCGETSASSQCRHLTRSCQGIWYAYSANLLRDFLWFHLCWWKNHWTQSSLRLLRNTSMFSQCRQTGQCKHWMHGCLRVWYAYSANLLHYPSSIHSLVFSPLNILKKNHWTQSKITARYQHV